MYMYDPEIGEMDVELEIPMQEPRASRITCGYVLDTFQELTPDEIDYLNEKYILDILAQAEAILQGEAIESVKLYH